MSQMTKKFVKKNIKLMLEFDDYLTKHPKLYDSIPDGAVVVMTLKYDKKFSDDSMSIAMSHKPQRPIIKAEKARTQWSLTHLSPGLV